MLWRRNNRASDSASPIPAVSERQRDSEREEKFQQLTVLPGTDKSLARPGRKQARKHVRDARYFNKIGTRAVVKFIFLQGKAPKEIRAILTEALACFLPGRAKDLSTSLY